MDLTIDIIVAGTLAALAFLTFVSVLSWIGVCVWYWLRDNGFTLF